MKAFEDWSIEDVKRHSQRIKSQTTNHATQVTKSLIKQSRSKYGNEKVEVAGEKFDSKKEADRYAELERMDRVGLIDKLERQKKYVLQPKFKFLGRTIREVSYVADFVYEENGKLVVEDVKSPITRSNPVYRLKKKMMMYVHNIEIKEV